MQTIEKTTVNGLEVSAGDFATLRYNGEDRIAKVERVEQRADGAVRLRCIQFELDAHDVAEALKTVSATDLLGDFAAWKMFSVEKIEDFAKFHIAD